MVAADIFRQQLVYMEDLEGGIPPWQVRLTLQYHRLIFDLWMWVQY
jgi:hypothetical protein